MVSLSLEEIERELEEGLLSENYEFLTEESGERCTELVLKYIKNTDSVSNKNIIFIKQLTKIAHNIQKDSNSLDDLLDKLYSFNMAGVNKIRDYKEKFVELKNINGDVLSYNNLISLESHLLAYAGEDSKSLFNKKEELCWAENWRDCCRDSAELIKYKDIKYASFNYGSAGDANKVLFEKTGDVSLAKKAHEYYKTSADMRLLLVLNSIDEVVFARNLAESLFRNQDESFISSAEKSYLSKEFSEEAKILITIGSLNIIDFTENFSRILFEKEKDVFSSKEECLATKISEDYKINEYFERAIRKYDSAGNIAEEISKVKKEETIYWAKEWYIYHKFSADMTMKTNSKHSAYMYYSVAKASKKIFKKERDISLAKYEKYENLFWIKEAYKYNKISAEMTSIFDAMHSAQAHGFAGNAASDIGKITKNKKWNRIAIKHYRKFIKYYEENPNLEMNELIDCKKSNIDFLKQFI